MKNEDYTFQYLYLSDSELKLSNPQKFSAIHIQEMLNNNFKSVYELVNYWNKQLALKPDNFQTKIYFVN